MIDTAISLSTRGHFRILKSGHFNFLLTLLTMVYKLGLCAEKNWRRLRGFRHLADVIENVKFIDGVKEEAIQQHQQAA